MTEQTIYHRMRSLNRRMAANYLRGFGPRRMVLLLTTTGRKTGQPHVTPLQYEELDDIIYVISARGTEADWFKNIQASPHVQVQIGDRQFDALAEPVTDPTCIADFIEMRLERHPLMIRLIMYLFDGLPLRYSRQDLEALCSTKAMLVLHLI